LQRSRSRDEFGDRFVLRSGWRVVDARELILRLERWLLSPLGQQFDDVGGPGHGFNDKPVALTVDQHTITGKLEFDGEQLLLIRSRPPKVSHWTASANCFTVSTPRFPHAWAIGSVEVRSHLMVADGVDLVIEHGRAGLSPEQVREFVNGVMVVFAQVSGEERVLTAEVQNIQRKCKNMDRVNVRVSRPRTVAGESAGRQTSRPPARLEVHAMPSSSTLRMPLLICVSCLARRDTTSDCKASF